MRQTLFKLAVVAVLTGLAAPSLAVDTSPLVATTLDGARFDLAGERGRVVIVNFWATWCAPCRAEMPALDAYYRAHLGDGFDLLAISLDADGSRKKLLAATAAFRFPVARIADTRMARSAIPTGLPATRIYGRDGTLRYDSAERHGQPLDAAALQRIVAPLLAEPAPTTR
jgi:thiol-disulfide isomerase/thioredoxin